MSLHLKSRRQCAPNGFYFRQAQSGWELTAWDFEQLCQQLRAHRLANPSLGLPTDLDSIREEVDVTNANRVALIPNAESYVTGGAMPPKTRAFHGLNPRLQSAAEGVKKLAKGAGLLIDWIIEGANPVSAEVANARAQVCVKCPLNSPEALGSFFTKKASELIRKEIEQRKVFDMTTPYDDKLGICKACLCVLTLKCHCPLSYINEHMAPEVKADLDPGCWILHEK